MASEIEPGVLKMISDRSHPVQPDIGTDRVLVIAGDRSSSSQDSLPTVVDPAHDHEHDAVLERRRDVDEKHERVVRYLEQTGYQAVILGHADSLAWFTAGGDLGQTMSAELGAIQIFVNARARVVICDNVQSARVFEEELAGLGFQLKEWAWTADPASLLQELVRNKRVASDGFARIAGLCDERPALRALRYPYTPLERQRLRELGRTLSLTLEATCRNFEPGESEADLAGHLAHRLLREGVVPVDLSVAADDRLGRFRQPRFKSVPIEHGVTLAAVGRRHGLCAAASRTVSFGEPEPAFREAHGLAAMVDATGLYFSRPGELVSGVYKRTQRIFEKYGHADEWRLDYQGFLVGYAGREEIFRPNSNLVLLHGMPVCWSPTVGSARSQDTVVVDERGFEVVTEAQRWPMLEVQVKESTVNRPNILVR